MPFRSVRLTDFTTTRLPGAVWDVELLCRDSRGVYVLPFPGRRIDGDWVNGRTDEKLEVEVIGWRLWEDRFKTEPTPVGTPRMANGGGRAEKPLIESTGAAPAGARTTSSTID